MDPNEGETPQEYSQRRVISQIHDRKKAVIETRNEVQSALLNNDEFYPASVYLFQSVQNLILTLAPILEEYEREERFEGESYWSETTIGEFETESDGEKQINGLKELIPETPTYKINRTIVTDLATEDRETRSTYPPKISLEAYRLCSQFIREIGIGYELPEKASEDVYFDYSEFTHPTPEQTPDEKLEEQNNE